MDLGAVVLCLVVGVTDGDTLRVRCGTQPEEPVRVAEIDAPEAKQPFGTRSRQALAELCHRQEAHVAPIALDRYRRVVAKVECRGRDAGAAQVESGMAWVFDAYVRDRSLYRLQDLAREQRTGLWADPAPVAPWVWRKAAATRHEAPETP